MARAGPGSTSAPPPSGPPPPPTLQRESTSWTQVVGRKEKRRQTANNTPAKTTSTEGRRGMATTTTTRTAATKRTATKGGTGGGARNQPPPPPPKLRKPPRTAAVQVACPESDRAETMRIVRARVNLNELGIREMLPRRARTGALLLEIPGAEGGKKADALAAKLREALADRQGVAVTRPTKTAEIRVRDLEDSVSAADVAAALAEKGGCHPNEITVGPIRRWTVNGLGTAWVRCPLTAANRLAREGAVRVGWTRARVEVLPERALRCFKCWGMGHVRAACSSEVDRTASCYRCGTRGHQARGCDAPVNCALCADSNRPSNHRAGGPACRAPKPRRGTTRRTATALAPAPRAPAPPEGGGTPMEIEEGLQKGREAAPPGGAPGGNGGNRPGDGHPAATAPASPIRGPRKKEE